VVLAGFVREWESSWMDLAGWALYGLTAAAALAMVGYLYGRRELPGRGRKILVGLRWAALAILLLLLFDPSFSVPGVTGGRDRVQVLLDGSLSMGLPLRAGEPGTRWSAAIEEARRAAGGGELLVFGERPRVVAADSLAGWVPDAAGSRLAPALRAAAEAGARKVVVVTDGGIDDLPEVNRLLPELGLGVEVRTPGGGALVNRGITSVEAPDWGETGKPLEVRVGIGAIGEAGDSVRVVLRGGEEVLAEAVVPTPQSGLEATAVLSFTPEPPAEGELVRYDIALTPGDAVADDDLRSIYVAIAEEPAGVAFVSFRPDWEPRFLQPVLEQALGLPVRGYLQAQSGKFLRLGSGGDAGRPSGEAEVRRALERASLVVLHGLDGSAPAWARDVAQSGRRVLIFPAGNGAGGLPVSPGALAPGEWHATGEVPASPVAALLAELRLEGLPPLTAIRPLELPAGAWAPLLASRDRGGRNALPVVAGLERDGRRTVVALADGFWRWALREGTGRQAYRRLWSALGGWLLEDDRLADAGPVHALNRVAPRGVAPRWVAVGTTDAGRAPAGAPLDSVALRVLGAADEVVLDTVLTIAAGDTVATPVLPPGHYRYEARRVTAAGSATGGAGAAGGGGAPAVAGGVFTVESYSPEYLREPVALAEVAAAAAAETAPVRRGPGRPLHTEPWPYLAFVLLVSTEWIFRRRWGLR
jgi:hypothetical protein